LLARERLECARWLRSATGTVPRNWMPAFNSRVATSAAWMCSGASISGTAVVNQVIFIVALRWLPDVAAAALASTVVSIVNFILGHFFVFTTTNAKGPLEAAD